LSLPTVPRNCNRTYRLLGTLTGTSHLSLSVCVLTPAWLCALEQPVSEVPVPIVYGPSTTDQLPEFAAIEDDLSKHPVDPFTCVEPSVIEPPVRICIDCGKRLLLAPLHNSIFVNVYELPRSRSSHCPPSLEEEPLLEHHSPWPLPFIVSVPAVQLPPQPHVV